MRGSVGIGSILQVTAFTAYSADINNTNSIGTAIFRALIHSGVVFIKGGSGSGKAGSALVAVADGSFSVGSELNYGSVFQLAENRFVDIVINKASFRCDNIIFAGIHIAGSGAPVNGVQKTISERCDFRPFLQRKQSVIL